MSSKVGDFQKAGATFPYFLFLVSYSLFQFVFTPLRALRETKKSVQRLNEFKKFKRLGNSRLPMLVFSPIIKEGEFA